jgi:hypothetical protein
MGRAPLPVVLCEPVGRRSQSHRFLSFVAAVMTLAAARAAHIAFQTASFTERRTEFITIWKKQLTAAGT